MLDFSSGMISTTNQTVLNEQDPKFDGNIKAAQEKILSDDNGEIDFEEFRMLANDFPLM